MRFLLRVALAVCLLTRAASAHVGAELIPNGDLQRTDGSGWPVGWPQGRGARIGRDADGPKLVCAANGSGVTFRIPLKPEYGRLKLSMGMRVREVACGKESWQTGRLTMSFHEQRGARIGAWPNVFGMVGSTEWTDCERIYPVPEGAVTLSLSPCNLGVAGTAEFRRLSLTVERVRAKGRSDVPLPREAEPDPWGLGDAWRQATPTRERVCLNGLWGFRPVLTNETAGAVPPVGDSWGWFKIPGIWPDDLREPENGAQQVELDPWLEENAELRGLERAWYKRRFTVPAAWAGRRVSLEFTLLQTHARLFADGRPCGEVWYPGGEVDLTGHLRPGKDVELAMLVTARPLTAEHTSFMAPERVITSKANVRFKGVTGDLFLRAVPAGPALESVQVVTSVRERNVTFRAETAGLDAGPWRLRAAVVLRGKLAEPRVFESGRLVPDPDGTLRFTASWPDARLWDTDTPQNRYDLHLTLLDAAGRAVDVLTPVTFGFREFRIAGRDFLLNGTPVHLRALHNTAANDPADKAAAPAVRELCRRMAGYGFNAIIGGNYDFAPGSVGYLDGLLDACDESGMLMAFSLPHIKDFERRLDRPETAADYRRLTRWLIRRARNHPAVVLYAMNHNCTGYYGDQNPLKIDGVYEIPAAGPNANAWWEGNRRQARIAEAIAKALDPTRPVYHHQSGNLGDLHTVNCYLNWAPIQERSEWVAHWSVRGAKPLFFVEWGLPHISSWSSYRGPQFIWRCEAFQSLWAAEYAAPFWGDTAYRDDDAVGRALDHEEALWASGKPFRWGELNAPLRTLPQHFHAVQALFANDNWRSHRAWGVSAMLPWDQGEFWKRVAPTRVTRNPDARKKLKRPGIVPDRLLPDGQYISDPGAPEAFAPTAVGQAMMRWNQPDCAFIGGPPEAFTDKRHLFAPGETVRKSLVLINDRRRAQTVRWTWRLWQKGDKRREREGRVVVPAGAQARVPVVFPFPETATEGLPFRLTAVFAFEDGVVQVDEQTLHTVKPALPPRLARPVGLYDPKGLTAALFDRLRVPYERCDGARLPQRDAILVIGREALDGKPLPWLADLPQGRRTLVFEQNAAALEGQLGFRIAERGERRLFTRFAHPVTQAFDEACFRDWGGEATLLAPHLSGLPDPETHDPHWTWCGFRNTRVWRCGNRGNVASVLIEKPAKGDWRVLLDGGFDLQYAALLEHVAASGRVIFCQADVTGRRGVEPMADRLVVNLLAYLDRARSERARRIVCAGGGEVADLLAAIGAGGVVSFPAADRVWEGTNTLLVAGPGAVAPAGLARQVAAGLNVLCLGMSGAALQDWCPIPVSTVPTNAVFERIEAVPPELAGLCNADWAWHGRMVFDAMVIPPGERSSCSPALRVFRQGAGRVVVWQVPPWRIDERAKPYLRTSKRRAHVLAARLMANLGGALSAPVGLRFSTRTDRAWLESYYLDIPEAGDDPYRYYRW